MSRRGLWPQCSGTDNQMGYIWSFEPEKKSAWTGAVRGCVEYDRRYRPGHQCVSITVRIDNNNKKVKNRGRKRSNIKGLKAKGPDDIIWSRASQRHPVDLATTLVSSALGNGNGLVTDYYTIQLLRGFRAQFALLSSHLTSTFTTYLTLCIPTTL